MFENVEYHGMVKAHLKRRLHKRRLKIDCIMKMTELPHDIFKHYSTRVERVTELLEYIKRNPQWRFHGLLRALHENDQNHVIRFFGMDPDDYSDQMVDDNKQDVSGMQIYKCDGPGPLNETGDARFRDTPKETS